MLWNGMMINATQGIYTPVLFSLLYEHVRKRLDPLHDKHTTLWLCLEDKAIPRYLSSSTPENLEIRNGLSQGNQTNASH